MDLKEDICGYYQINGSQGIIQRCPHKKSGAVE
jgi:hypothetical protein